MRVCPVMGGCAQRLLGRPMSWSLFLPVFESAKTAFRDGFLGWVFGMFCLFRAALLSAFSAVYWLGMA